MSARPLLQRARRGTEPPGRCSASNIVHDRLVEVVLARGGAQRVCLDGVTSSCRVGDYGIAFPGTKFSSFTERSGLTYSLLVLDAPQLGALAEQAGAGSRWLDSGVRPASRRLVAAVDMLEAELREDPSQPGHELAVESLATLVGVALVRSQVTSWEAARDDDERGVARVEERLRSTLDRTPSLQELATLAGTTRHQLLRAFRKRYGVPPARYHQRLRAARAFEVLSEGGTTASAVAADFGYGSPSRLSEAMRRFYGRTPTQIARQR